MRLSYSTSVAQSASRVLSCDGLASETAVVGLNRQTSGYRRTNGGTSSCSLQGRRNIPFLADSSADESATEDDHASSTILETHPQHLRVQSFSAMAAPMQAKIGTYFIGDIVDPNVYAIHAVGCVRGTDFAAASPRCPSTRHRTLYILSDVVVHVAP